MSWLQHATMKMNKCCSRMYASSSSRGSLLEFVDCRSREAASLLNKPHWLYTCEHASAGLPEPYEFGSNDTRRRLGSSHWAYDIGSADLARELVASTSSTAILARYSRLLVDLNRPIGSPSLSRPLCDNQLVDLNINVTHEEQMKRLNEFYIPYHLQASQLAKDVEATAAITVHSYTPNYEGQIRNVEVGVLSSVDDRVASQIVEFLASKGYNAKVNQPWSGKDGFMFAVDSLMFACQPQIQKTVMVEVRNDLLSDAEWRANFVPHLVSALSDSDLDGSSTV